MKRSDRSFDIILSTKSEPTSNSFFGRLVRSVSRSFEKFTEVKKINYDIEKMHFSKYLTSDVLKLNRKDLNYFTQYEVNIIEQSKTEQINFINYLKNMKLALKNNEKNKDFYNFLEKKRIEIEKEISEIQNLKLFLIKLKDSQKISEYHMLETKTKIENLRFDKIKDFEKRGRYLIIIKKIESILSVIERKRLGIDVNVKNQLNMYRLELISALKMNVELKRKIDLVKRQSHYESEIKFYQIKQSLLKQ